jgi:hypothetical protein
MAIEYQKWAPVENMLDKFLDASVRHENGTTSVLLMPFAKGASTLCVRFTHVLAYAVFDDFAFALSNIEYGLPGVPTFVVRNYDWPGPHKRYEDSGCKEVTCYRFGSQNTIIDVLAWGPVVGEWIAPNG